MAVSNARAMAERALKPIILRPIRTGGTTQAFNWAFCYPHEKHHTTELATIRTRHPCRDLLMKRWEDADKTGLMTYIYATQRVAKSGLIRRHHMRRLRGAVKEVLREQGLNRHGKPVKAFEENNKAMPLSGNSGPIVGSLDLTPKADILHLKYADLLAAVRSTLGSIQTLQDMPLRRSRITSGSRQDNHWLRVKIRELTSKPPGRFTDSWTG